MHSYALAADADVFSTSPTITAKTTTHSSPVKNGGISQPLAKCLAAVQDMYNLSLSSSVSTSPTRNPFTPNPTSNPTLPTLLVLLIRLQLLVRHGIWTHIPAALSAAESAFEEYEPASAYSDTTATTPAPSAAGVPLVGVTPSTSSFPPIPPVMRVQLLILAVLVHTYAGDAEAAVVRLRVLHALVDGGALKSRGGESGVLEVNVFTSLIFSLLN